MGWNQHSGPRPGGFLVVVIAVVVPGSEAATDRRIFASDPVLGLLCL